MKPEAIHPEDNLETFKPWINAENRKALMENIIARRDALFDPMWDALTTIDGMYGLGDGTIDSTAVVVLELRQHETLGEYAILAKLGIDGQDQRESLTEKERHERKAYVKFGFGFDHPAALAIEEEHELGQGIDNRYWYGAWDRTEASSDVDSDLSRLAKWGTDPRGTAESHHQLAVGKLESITESIAVVLAAAMDHQINPPPKPVGEK
jgi:hypothetical protein